MLTRRGLLRGLGAVLAAPAIVRASSLMAISPVEPSSLWRELIDSEMFASFPGFPPKSLIVSPELRAIAERILREAERDIVQRADWMVTHSNVERLLNA